MLKCSLIYDEFKDKISDYNLPFYEEEIQQEVLLSLLRKAVGRFRGLCRNDLEIIEVEIENERDKVFKVDGEVSIEHILKYNKGDITLILLTDVTETDSFTVRKSQNVMLNLNGKSLTMEDSYIDVYGNLTVSDSKGNGYMLSAENEKNSLFNVCNGKLILNDGVFETKYGMNVIAVHGNGKAYVEGGYLISGDSCIVACDTDNDSEIEINGGQLTSWHKAAAYFADQCSFTINDGILNGGISARMGSIEINGGTINSAESEMDSIGDCYGSKDNVYLSDVIYSLTGTFGSDNGNDLDIVINDGNFNVLNNEGNVIAIYDLGNKEQSADILVKDGVFKNNDSDGKPVSIIGYDDFVHEEEYPGNWGLYSGNTVMNIKGGVYDKDVDEEYITRGYESVHIDDAYIVCPIIPEISDDSDEDEDDEEEYYHRHHRHRRHHHRDDGTTRRKYTKAYYIQGDLSYEEIDILVEWMIYFWLSPYLNNSDNLQNVLNTKDFTQYSNANLVSTIKDIQLQTKKDALALQSRYSIRYGKWKKMRRRS